MSLQGIPLEKISEADIQRLISLAVPESPYLDYKLKTYDGSGEQHSEFLADISSFANTLGGDLVIGVSEEGGLPISVSPFIGDCDSERRRLEQLALSGLEPRLASFHTHAVPVSGGHVLIVRVGRSYMPPHRIIARKSNRFWARAGTMKYEPNVEQLRRLFNDAPLLADRIRQFQSDRIVKITAGDTPFQLSGLGKVVIHVVPLPAFADGRMLDIMAALTAGTHLPLPPAEVGLPKQGAPNLDGYLNYTGGYDGARRAYAQFFRNGAIEGVGEFRSDDGKSSRFISADFCNVVVGSVRQYLQVLKSFDMGIPLYIFLALCNAENTKHRYVVFPGAGWNETEALGRALVTLPELVIDDYDVDVASALRPIFNVLWNAFGLAQCDMYDGKGKFTGV